MKKGQSVIQAAQNLVNRHIRDSIEKAISPISDEIKAYISTLVEVAAKQRSIRQYEASAAT